MARILTTHAGSLPRPTALVELLVAQSRGEAVDARALAAAVEAATRHVVAQQLDCGHRRRQRRRAAARELLHLRAHRVSGFGGASAAAGHARHHALPELPRAASCSQLRTHAGEPAARRRRRSARCATSTREPLERELRRLRARAAGRAAARLRRVVLTAPSPGIVACGDAERALRRRSRTTSTPSPTRWRTEYEAIAAHGFVLQIDAPIWRWSATRSFADRPLDEFLAFVDLNDRARSTARSPTCRRERVRLHVCWGNYEGPHTFDVPLEDAPAAPLPGPRRRAGAVDGQPAPRARAPRASPRSPLPDDWLLVAGVIDTTTNYVEHPEVVADRIELAARAVGDPHRVLAGTDCGFDTAAGLGEVAEEVVWEKLRALRAGADLAARRLFG